MAGPQNHLSKQSGHICSMTAGGRIPAMSRMWEGRQAGCWGPGGDQAHTLKGQSFTQAAPRGKRCLAPSEEHGRNQQDVRV